LHAVPNGCEVAPVRYLSDADVTRALTLDIAVSQMENGFRAFAHGRAVMQPRIRTQLGGSKLSTLGAIVPDDGVLGAKVYATAADGTFEFLVVLFAEADGRRLAVLEAATLTELRTAATTVIAARRLAKADAASLAVFGAGRQARAQLAALVRMLGLRRVAVCARDLAAGNQLAQDVRRAHSIPAAATTRAEEALDGADLIVTATRSPSPLFPGNAVPPGAHLTALGATRPNTRELDDEAIGRSDIVAVEWKPQARTEADELRAAVDGGMLSWDSVVELGDLVIGRAPGRVRPDQITLFKSIGVALEDVALAAVAYRRAEEMGFGQVLG
jgi:ornithine cyclodeaminase